MPFGVIPLPTNDSVIPKMAYTNDTKAPLLPVPTTVEHAEQRCSCNKKCDKTKSRAHRAIRLVFFIGPAFLLVKAAFAHFNFKPWRCGTSETFGDMGMTHHRPEPLHPALHDLDHDEWFYDIPSGLELGDCVTGENFKEEESDGRLRAASTQFEVSKADTLFFLSRGQMSGGSVRVVSSPDQASDSATVKVTARYILDEIRGLAKVCASSRGEDARGVGAFTPTWHSSLNRPGDRDHIMYLETTVTLPEGSEGSLLTINNFETDVPNTAHSIDDLSKNFFNQFKLKATNLPFIQASFLAIGTTNGSITGRFNATDSIYFTTTNSPIEASVELHNEDDKTLFLIAKTTNRRLRLVVSATSSTDQPGTFDVNARTINSPLSIFFTDAPVDSKLTVSSSTTNGAARLSLHPTYEGKFQISTSRWFTAMVLAKDDIEDPAAKNRKRVTSTSIGRGEVHGETRWDADKLGPGNVVLSTTNSPVTLKLL